MSVLAFAPASPGYVYVPQKLIDRRQQVAELILDRMIAEVWSRQIPVQAMLDLWARIPQIRTGLHLCIFMYESYRACRKAEIESTTFRHIYNAPDGVEPLPPEYALFD